MHREALSTFPLMAANGWAVLIDRSTEAVRNPKARIQCSERFKPDSNPQLDPPATSNSNVFQSLGPYLGTYFAILRVEDRWRVLACLGV